MHTDDVLAVIDNPANYHHVMALKTQLDTFKTAIFPAFGKPEIGDISESAHFPAFKFQGELGGIDTLGELQAAYTRLNRAYADYQFFLELDYHQQKINAIEKQVEKRQQLIAKAEAGAGTLQIQVAYLQKSILDLQLQYREQQRQLQLGLIEAYGNLINQIEAWAHRYMLKSPLDGTVTFTQYWTVNQQVRVGHVVMTVVPETAAARIIGKVYLPILGAGKV
ncbi:MAG: hypothetical protein DRR19_26250 [Candidatus Parabeggiatoa sp. nov. 1]|nr:MAG: hypothetical protein DRR19_26250 [Gammaproteobacteria bacterium]